ncbi:lytic polysaccharide monooxygenase auxiliary activity family 9 protein [Streptomyces clavuligerus]|uniref:Chitin-binding domain-containing protein n=1 Tax=Streptomyces clavuligerus TaxID=1901 RepID=E2PXA0_STRCL|nr:lytic polysaccharide monooxygenase [Streptomyces clavuligerus]ANW20921.1 chitin-binding protein [Streptomyces clavuligerus]AXU15542.1 LPXTG cell wall anchor domain-containing protein [Streptomyces clavuligerus]EFG06022.1 Chitin-binding domain-containing protein [Streptomyces clavuligerus]MBY6305648.1 lytic polysaccharide monooxygenase [Streptomyces clavuligerus]QCS08320.1 chitin-binding protein [Streptomyces clavuligerus]
MTTRRTAAVAAALGVVPLALTALTVTPAAAHGSMLDPVSRVSACFAEGPESPDSAACKAMVAAGGTQPLYDWNEVNIGDAAGRHRQIIPDGKLCSVGRDKYKGLDAPRADWPSSPMAAGSKTFRWRATAPHRGTLELYITREGYDPTKPLKWSDLEAQPFAKVTDPRLENGSYVFDGQVPNRTGRHLIYSILQRSDSPEAFYTCSDVVFGGKAPAGAPAAQAPSENAIEQGAGNSSVDHGGHGGDTAAEKKANAEHVAQRTGGGNAPQTQVAHTTELAATSEQALAETGGDSTSMYIAIGGAAALALGAAGMFASARRRAGGSAI